MPLIQVAGVVNEHLKELYNIWKIDAQIGRSSAIINDFPRVTEYYSLLHPSFEDLLAVPLPSVITGGS